MLCVAVCLFLKILPWQYWCSSIRHSNCENPPNETNSHNLTVEEIDATVNFEDPQPFDLTRGSEMQFSLIALRPGNVKVNMRWTEEGEPREADQSIRVSASA